MMNIEDALILVTWMEWDINGSGDNRYVTSHNLPYPYCAIMSASHKLTDMRFNSSWEWLMPVIEQISKFQYDDGETAFPRTFGMYEHQTAQYMFRYNLYIVHMNPSLIIAAYEATLEWINGCFNKHGD